MIDSATIFTYVRNNSVRIIRVAFIVIIIFTIIMMMIEGTSLAGAYTSLIVIFLSGLIGFTTTFIGNDTVLTSYSATI
jgi:FtsH-binding integral membrane protein